MNVTHRTTLIVLAWLRSGRAWGRAAAAAAAAAEEKKAKDQEQKAKDDEPKPANEYERIAADLIRFQDDVAATLKTVKDEASAKAAVPKFDGYRKRVLDIRTRSETAGNPDDAARDAMMKKYGERLKASSDAFTQEHKRIESDAKLAKIMSEPLKKLAVFESGHGETKK
jgi:hypothetical protein